MWVGKPACSIIMENLESLTGLILIIISLGDPDSDLFTFPVVAINKGGCSFGVVCSPSRPGSTLCGWAEFEETHKKKRKKKNVIASWPSSPISSRTQISP